MKHTPQEPYLAERDARAACARTRGARAAHGALRDGSAHRVRVLRVRHTAGSSSHADMPAGAAPNACSQAVRRRRAAPHTRARAAAHQEPSGRWMRRTKASALASADAMRGDQLRCTRASSVRALREQQHQARNLLQHAGQHACSTHRQRHVQTHACTHASSPAGAGVRALTCCPGAACRRP